MCRPTGQTGLGSFRCRDGLALRLDRPQDIEEREPLGLDLEPPATAQAPLRFDHARLAEQARAGE